MAIASAAAKLRAKSFTVDGEAVVPGADGVAVFDALHRRIGLATPSCTLDLLELDGEELRSWPLSERKTKLARLLARSPAGIELCEGLGAKLASGGRDRLIAVCPFIAAAGE
jgi:bifunctional non-homologous end joining protein LigD